ncbi:MAG: hypothetical protein RSE41_01705 [Clostridia bacterium]
MNKDLIKNVIIGILSLVLIIVIIFILKPKTIVNSNDLLKNIILVQSNISEYVGKTKSDTFNIYNTELILIGSSNIEKIEDSKIVNNNNEELISLISLDDKKKIKDINYYKLNVKNISKLFKISLTDEVTWYIDSNGNIKILNDKLPKWWTSNLDIFLI